MHNFAKLRKKSPCLKRQFVQYQSSKYSFKLTNFGDRQQQISVPLHDKHFVSISEEIAQHFLTNKRIEQSI